MYIDLAQINDIAKIITSIGAIVTLIVAVYKFVERDKAQQKDIRSIKKELKIVCGGVLACLKGLHEKGCDGPVDKALAEIEQHLTDMAHGEGSD